VCFWKGPTDPARQLGLVVSRSYTSSYHCGTWPDQIVVEDPRANPPGSGPRFYLKGDWSNLLGEFHRLKRVPADARDTGFRHGTERLWVPAQGDNEVYVVNGSRVEAWPRTTLLAGCA
jgi:hypothetical protein